MFDVNSFGAAGKRLNGEFLKTLPKMALKGTIVGGGVKSFEDREKGGTQSVPYLLITSGAFEGEKELSLNATNRNILKATYGAAASAWIGKEIGIYFDPTVSYQGKPVGGVKVKSLEDPFADEKPKATVVDLQEVPF